MDIGNSHWWNGKDPRTFFPSVYRHGDNSEEGYLDEHLLSLDERTKRECDLVELFLKTKHGARILDCPCGYGRHSVELASRGYDVTGVELCPQFLKEARSASNALPVDSKCKFIEGDIRSLPSELNNFDACINMFFSFGFFDEESNLKVLQEFYRVLANKGKLLIHTDVNPDRIAVGKYGDRSLRTLNDGASLRIDENFDTSSKRLNGRWSIHYKDGSVVRRDYSIRVYSHDEMTGMLREVGFSDTHILYPSKQPQQIKIPSQEVFYVASK